MIGDNCSTGWKSGSRLHGSSIVKVNKDNFPLEIGQLPRAEEKDHWRQVSGVALEVES